MRAIDLDALCEDAKAFANGGERPTAQLRSISYAEYLSSYTPAEYLIDRLVLRSSVYGMTALTGHGKTAIATTLALHLACGRRLGELELAHDAKVLLLSGENDYDQQCRAIATSQELGLDPGPNMRIIAGSYPISSALEAIREDDAAHGPYAFVIADTSVAFFGGDDENDNPQLRAHAAAFRELTRLRGRPAVLVLCHPTKAAARENLSRGAARF
jgi:RecA-family ATPase